MTESNANPEPTTTPPAAPPAPPAPSDGGGDLAALQAQIDAARQAGGTTATAELVTSLGFESADDLAAAITAQREAEQAAMTEAERREQAAQAAERAAAARQAEADKLIRTGVANLALVRAGVDPENLADAARLLDLPDGELTDEAADAAVEALKAKPIAASVFAAPSADAKPPSGTTGQPPNERTGGSTQTADERADENLRRLFPQLSAAATSN